MMEQLKSVIAVVLITKLSAVYSLPGCNSFTELDICQEMQYGDLLLDDFDEAVFSTPGDPFDDCLNYKERTSCAILVRAKSGQRIAVRTGSEYNLASGYSSSCEGQDSFIVDGRCVKPSLGKDQDAFLTSSFLAKVNFTSYGSHSESESKAFLSLRAFGCPLHTLVDEKGTNVQVIDERRLQIGNNSYQVKVSCKNANHVIQESQQKEMIINCTRLLGSSDFVWDREDGSLLKCAVSKLTVIIAVVVTVLLVICLVILFILWGLRWLPCQKAAEDKAVKQEETIKDNKRYGNVDADDDMAVSCHTINEAGDKQGIFQSTELHPSHDAISQRENFDGSNNHVCGNGSQGLLAAEVSTYWDGSRNGKQRKH